MEITREIEAKSAQIEKLFEELQKLAEKADEPVQFPIPEYVGYIPAKWYKRYAKLQDREYDGKLSEAEGEELEAMKEMAGFVHYNSEIQAGPVWAPSAC